MRVALRVEVRTLRGVQKGVANLVRLLSEYQVRASFFFPLGRDLSGRSPVSAWQDRGSLGMRALLHGTLLPGPSLARAAAAAMSLARENGHEVGLLGLSPWSWSRGLAHADAPWVEQQCTRLWEAFVAAGGVAPTSLATPDWQIHPQLLGRLTPERYRYSTLTRGKLPYFPVLQGVRSAIPEIPTTLPTVDELLQQAGVSMNNVHEYLYTLSQRVLPAGHVFTASAEREGLGRLPLMEKMLVMWKGQDGSVGALGDLLQQIDVATLPYHRVGWGAIGDCPSPVAMQSLQVPA
jgi:undecaprenyl phosphate-alpha-L-ara4FN deformylase